MHSLVGLEEAFIVRRAMHEALPVENGGERFCLRGLDPLDGPLDGGAFDGLAHELIVEDVGQADRGHEGRILRIGRDEIFLGQLDQRLTHRRARRTEALGKLLLRQHGARQQMAGDDLAAEQRVNLHAHGLATHRGGRWRLITPRNGRELRSPRVPLLPAFICVSIPRELA